MRRIGSIAVCIAVGLLVAQVGASDAFAASPWWHVTSTARPAVLRTGVQNPEVQDLTVSGVKGEVFVLANMSEEEAQEVIGGKKSPERFTVLNVGAEAATVQAGLEEVYGPGNVKVTGGAGAQSGLEPYVVTFAGSLTDQSVQAMNTELDPLVGFAGHVTVAQAAEGHNNGELLITATNLGDASAEGASKHVTITDRLPAGVDALAVRGEILGRGIPSEDGTCTIEAAQSIRCEFSDTVAPYYAVQANITVGLEKEHEAGAAGLDQAAAIGGGAPEALIERPLQFGAEPVFGMEGYEIDAEGEAGTADTQAGSHPFQLTTTVKLSQTADSLPVSLVKDINVNLPAGLVGNPTAIPECSLAQFHSIDTAGFEAKTHCPTQTAIGVTSVLVNRAQSTSKPTPYRVLVPVFNLEPAVGEPARFGFFVPEGNVPVLLDTSVRSGEDYGVTVHVGNISQAVAFLSSEVTLWGVPGDARHDAQRGNTCLKEPESAACVPSIEQHPPALLSMPTSCTGRLQSSVDVDSWMQEGRFASLASEQLPAMDGCARLPFSPSIQVTPDGTAASSATGLTVDVHVPQEETLNPNGLAESDPRNITVALPEGVAVNPAGSDGLQACSEGLVGFTGFANFDGESTTTFTPTLPEHNDPPEALKPGVNFCSDASKIGTAAIRTPLLPHPIEGAIYIANQDENPFGSLIAIYIVAEDPNSGVLIKLAGDVHLSSTGQIVTTFENSPQAPFEDAELHFFGGERAPLGTPARCGVYMTDASFTPWSAEPGEAPKTSSSSFAITGGPNGSPCPGQSLPFSPSLTAGTTSIQAGGFSPFTMTMSRADGQQNLQAIQLHMPPGLSGLLSSVKLCGEPQAGEGLCGPESEIGETIVSVGLGDTPFSVKGGKVFITEGYEGAPYGLSIVNPAKAGPFDLERGTPCDCVVVRAKIEVDPITAALTITSDSTGLFKIPTILDGIPLEIQHVNVTINRSGFTFNPTNCEPMHITGALDSTEGAVSDLSVPLQVTNCAVLGFKPAFSVSTAGKTSRTNGASLHVKLVYPKAPFGSQANIRSVKVDLPKQLPSRLTTLQKACPDSTFNKNPAACGPESRIGSAKASTPLLPVPLTGPVYFVSHAGLKFPELVIVLSGYGTTIQLHAETFISKAGITSSTFRTIPDAPVGTFELVLPQGKYSALAAPFSLCKTNLKMPTAFTAQNGATIKQSTPITVTGCAKKAHKKAKKPSKRRKGKVHGR